MSEEYKWQKDKLKELTRALYGYSTVDYAEGNPFQIFFGSGSGLTSKFSLKTKRFQEKLEKLLLHTFTDKNVEFDCKNHEINTRIVVQNALVYFIGKDELQRIIEQCSTCFYKKYIPTTQSIFKVMENYDSFQGIPMICTEEQLKDCVKKYGNRYISNSSNMYHENKPKRITLEKLLNDHSDVVDTLSKQINSLLVDELLPLFYNKELTEDEQEKQYSQAVHSIKEQLKDISMEEFSKKLNSNRQLQEETTNRIVFIDSKYEFDKPKKLVEYRSELLPILTNWHIPEHQYITYQKPDLEQRDVKSYISFLAGSRYDPCRAILPDPDKPVLKFMISDKQEKYQQSMFQKFQIQYLTFEEEVDTERALFEFMGPEETFYNADIIEREQEAVTAHFSSVIDSITDILHRIFAHSGDFTSLIKEQFEEDESKEPSQKSEYKNRTDKDMIRDWQEIFCQEKLLMFNKNTFSAFVTQDLIMRHYLIQWDRMIPAHKDMIGDDYIKENRIGHLTYIIIPLIGDFVSELKENVKEISCAATKIMTVSAFGRHLSEINCYINNFNLDKAIVQWNESYEVLKCQNAEHQRRKLVKPENNLLGIKNYAENNGNLFQNLKDALQQYHDYMVEALRLGRIY